MEAGYDYLHGRLQRRVANLTGALLLTVGLLLLAAGGAYYEYAANAKSNLNEMVTDVAPRTVNPITGISASNVRLFPGEAIPAESWTDLLGHEPLYSRQQRLLEASVISVD